MAQTTTQHVRSVTLVATAAVNGDTSQRIEIDAQGEMRTLRDAVNRLLDEVAALRQ